MIRKWGSFIEKHPWMVVISVIIITIGFSVLLPNIQFKTDFKDFTPDDDLVRANNRVMRTFGTFTQPMLIIAQINQADSTISPAALREQYAIEKALQKKPEVNSTISIATFVDAICRIEFGQSFENCTDTQLQTAINDLLNEPSYEKLTLLSTDDPNEPNEYQKFPYIQGKSVNSLDIKNGYLSNNSHSYQFSIEVYNLKELSTKIEPLLPKTNIIEWYIGFDNLVTPDKNLDISYQITVRIEPTHPFWEFGKGFRSNIHDLITAIKTRTLFNSYTTTAYLWLKPADQKTYFPLQLHTANISFKPNANLITIDVSKQELRKYGIAPQFGSFELPGKLANFSLGSRWYQSPGIIRKGGRITYNTTFFLNRLQKLKQHPILGKLIDRFLQKNGGITWQDFNQLFNLIQETQMLPDTIAPQDLYSTWKPIDQTIKQSTDTIYIIYPSYFKEIQVNSLSFLSQDYLKTKKPTISLIIANTEYGTNYEQTVRLNNKLVQEIKEIDAKNPALTLQVTGQGVISGEINEITTNANMIIGPSIFIIIFGILLLNFRKLSYVILAMAALMISTIWLFGSMVLLDIEFNVIAVALVPLILGLGVDYSVHLFHNYRSELEKGRSPAEAIRNSVDDIGTAMSLAMITTVIAFMSFLSSNIPPVRDFGILLALGVIFTFLTAITFLASLRYIIDLRKETVAARKIKFYSVRSIMSNLSQTIISHKKKIIMSIVIITIFFSTGVSQLDTGFDLNQFLPENTPTLLLYDKIAEEFPSSSQDQEYIFIEGDVATVTNLRGIAQTHQNLKDNDFISKNAEGSLKTVSIYTIIQQAIQNNETLIERYNIDAKTAIPKSNADVKALFDYLYGDTDTSLSGDPISIETINFEARNVLAKTESGYESTVIRIYIDPALQTQRGDINKDLQKLRKQLLDDLENYGEAEATVTGNLMVTLKITSSLTESQAVSTGISILLAAIVLIIAYRNLTLGLITMIPVGFSIIWILGTMYYIGYSLNVLTITVTSITIGIGIDYAIHATERFRLVADKTGDPEMAVCETISHTGGALFIAALTTTFGFGILIFAPIPPQQQFGLIIAITIAYSFLTSVLILPLALSKWSQARKKRLGFIISPTKSKNDHLKISCKPIEKKKP